jgi:hypothetical protein
MQGAVLPMAITVKIAREVLQEAGFDPNVVLLAANQSGEPLASKLAENAAIKLIDFTGSRKNGEWLEANCRHAQVYTEKAGVNTIVIDSTHDFKGLSRNIALSLALYGGQMCTAPQNIFIPAGGIETAEGHLSYEEVVAGIVSAINGLTADPAKAVEFLEPSRTRGPGPAGGGTEARSTLARQSCHRAPALSRSRRAYTAAARPFGTRPGNLPGRAFRPDCLRDQNQQQYRKPCHY